MRRLGLLMIGVAVATAGIPTESEMPDRAVLEAMRQARAQQDNVPAYSVIRRYTLRNKHLDAPMMLQVRWKYAPGAGRQYEIVDGNASGMARESLVRVLKEEANSSQQDDDPSAITPEHYMFHAAEASGQAENEYKLRLTPKEKTKYLLNGYAYVARDCGSVIRVHGKTAKRISFWVGEADIMQEFASYDGHWLPSRTKSTADVRLIGTAELTIESGDYQFNK